MDTYLISKTKLISNTTTVNIEEEDESESGPSTSTPQTLNTSNQIQMQQPQINVAMQRLQSYLPGMYLSISSYLFKFIGR